MHGDSLIVQPRADHRSHRYQAKPGRPSRNAGRSESRIRRTAGHGKGDRHASVLPSQSIASGRQAPRARRFFRSLPCNEPPEPHCSRSGYRCNPAASKTGKLATLCRMRRRQTRRVVGIPGRSLARPDALHSPAMPLPQAAATGPLAQARITLTDGTMLATLWGAANLLTGERFAGVTRRDTLEHAIALVMEAGERAGGSGSRPTPIRSRSCCAHGGWCDPPGPRAPPSPCPRGLPCTNTAAVLARSVWHRSVRSSVGSRILRSRQRRWIRLREPGCPYVFHPMKIIYRWRYRCGRCQAGLGHGRVSNLHCRSRWTRRAMHRISRAG
jgi:hypothetical protein